LKYLKPLQRGKVVSELTTRLTDGLYLANTDGSLLLDQYPPSLYLDQRHGEYSQNLCLWCRFILFRKSDNAGWAHSMPSFHCRYILSSQSTKRLSPSSTRRGLVPCLAKRSVIFYVHWDKTLLRPRSLISWQAPHERASKSEITAVHA
jgi:hypothetical protein